MVLPEDKYYLEHEDLCRQLVELGYRGNGKHVIGRSILLVHFDQGIELVV